jgi:hypothetical protein
MAASTDIQAICDKVYAWEKPDVINEVQRKGNKHDISFLQWASLRVCYRRTPLYMLNVDKR